MKEPNDRTRRAGLVALFLSLLLIGGIAVGCAVRLAYVRYTGEFGSGSFSALPSLPLPILCLILGAPLLGFLFAGLMTFRAIRRAKKKEEAERENDPDGEDENQSDF